MDIKMNRQSAAKHDLILKPFPIDLNGYETNYKISNDGRVWSEYLQDFLKPYHSKGGYLRVKVNFGDRNKKFMAHRLVALAFIPNKDPEKYTQVDHINNDRTDNRVENLQWVTPKQNTHLAFDRGSRDLFKYIFTNRITGEVIVFNNGHKACKYFGAKYQLGTINKYANTGKVITSGYFAGWIVDKESIMKVQRPSLAREQDQAIRNGNNPTDEFQSRVLIWSHLNRNIEQSHYTRPDMRDGYRFAPYTEENGSYDVWFVRADFSS